jgi:hypothetical protein
MATRVIPYEDIRKPIDVKDIVANSADTHRTTYGTFGKYTLEEAVEDFYKDGLNGEIWKVLTKEQQQAVRDIFIENRSEAFVKKLINNIEQGKISVDKISNYTTSWDEKLAYFSASI